jgi:hypothetical protein
MNMRSLIVLPLLALAACQVTKDDANDSITAEFNGDIAENGLEDAANFTENLAGAVANDVEQSADKVQNEVGDVDVDVDVDRDGGEANANAN